MAPLSGSPVWERNMKGTSLIYVASTNRHFGFRQSQFLTFPFAPLISQQTERNWWALLKSGGITLAVGIKCSPCSLWYWCVGCQFKGSRWGRERVERDSERERERERENTWGGKKEKKKQEEEMMRGEMKCTLDEGFLPRNPNVVNPFRRRIWPPWSGSQLALPSLQISMPLFVSLSSHQLIKKTGPGISQRIVIMLLLF